MKILAEPRVLSADVAFITHEGATTGDDGLIPQVRLARRKKVQFDVDDERDTFFESCDAIRRDPGKLHVYEMPPAFDSTLVEGLS